MLRCVILRYGRNRIDMRIILFCLIAITAITFSDGCTSAPKVMSITVEVTPDNTLPSKVAIGLAALGLKQRGSIRQESTQVQTQNFEGSTTFVGITYFDSYGELSLSLQMKDNSASPDEEARKVISYFCSAVSGVIRTSTVIRASGFNPSSVATSCVTKKGKEQQGADHGFRYLIPN